MTLLRFILALSIVTLLLFSRSLPTSAAADQDGGGVLIPFRRLLLSQPVKAGEKPGDDDHDFVSSVPKKFRIHMRKVRGGGIATRGRGRTSSAVRTQFSSSHFASFIGCSLFLGLMML